MRNRATTPLKKPKFRQSWSKYNLYNLTRLKLPPYRVKNFFQQKWLAKSLLRQYHGEQVREGQWGRMFSRKPRSVVPMNPQYLAANDGSIESAGRGSGLKLNTRQKPSQEPIPYMAMTFAPLERRLDTAVFRALFASSARQARQFVVHGAVKVNGKKMIYPGYLLNPGDMFQVEPERVLFATGRPKTSKAEKEESESNETESEADGETAAEKGESGEIQASESGKTESQIEDPRQTLKSLLTQAKKLLQIAPERVPGKRKQDAREFMRDVKRTLSRSTTSTILTDSLQAQFLELKRILKVPDNLPEKDSKKPSESPDGQTSETEGKTILSGSTTDTNENTFSMDDLTNSDLDALRRAMTVLHENPIDAAKPYATPWEPRDYMSAFAFIPRYLEVNQNICAAVYLRHPVARPGLAEVPSPYGEGIQSEAFAWYLRRR